MAAPLDGCTIRTNSFTLEDGVAWTSGGTWETSGNVGGGRIVHCNNVTMFVRARLVGVPASKPGTIEEYNQLHQPKHEKHLGRDRFD
jgi:hypothetical protein